MFDRDGFTFKGTTLFLMLASFALAFSHVVTIQWCSANGEFYGYFYDDAHELRSCVFNVPFEWFFTYGAVILNGFGMWNLFYDFIRTRDQWRETKRINISRVVFTLSFVTTNSLLEVLTHSYMRPNTESILYFAFDYLFFLLPTAIILLAVSAWTIINKVELYFDLSRRR
jgi:hypothetical protein